MSGQDTERGTFSQRHAVLHDVRRRPDVHAAAARVAGPGAGRDHQQPAVGSRRARLRIRLQPRLPRRARGVGSAVRRLRERGPGDHRSVHRQRRGQVAAAERHGAAVAARLRRAGARAFQRPAGAVPGAGGRRQHAGRVSHARRRNISTACGGRCCAAGASRWS